MTHWAKHVGQRRDGAFYGRVFLWTLRWLPPFVRKPRVFLRAATPKTQLPSTVVFLRPPGCPFLGVQGATGDHQSGFGAQISGNPLEWLGFRVLVGNHLSSKTTAPNHQNGGLICFSPQGLCERALEGPVGPPLLPG